MAANTRSKFQRKADYERITALYLRGWRQADIATELGLTQQQISYDLSVVQKQWQESTTMNLDEAKQKELSRIDELGYMRPCFTVDNCPYGALVDTILSGYISLSNALRCHLPDLYHVGASDFCTWVCFAKSVIVTFLVGSITVVIGGCAEPEMGRVDAGWIIAFMTNVHTFGNWAMTKLVADAMRSVLFLVGNDKTIPPWSCVAFPYPAIIWTALVNFFPKTLCEWSNGRLSVFAVGAVMSGNKACWLSFNVSDVRSCTFSEWGGLPATTFAKFYEVVFRGILSHVVSSFLAIGQAGGCFSNRPVFSLVTQV
jgi:hypothetical protein